MLNSPSGSMCDGELPTLPPRRVGWTAAIAALAGALAVSLPAHAQEEEAQDSSPLLSVELNAMQQVDQACRMTFVAANRLGAELEQAAFEIALFDTDGLVSRLTVIDFRDLPDGKTRVRQFDISDVDCGSVGRVLINDATQCSGDGVAEDACISALATSAASDIEFGS